MARNVMEKIKSDERINAMGVAVESIYFTAVTPAGEIAKALEAEYRESLQKGRRGDLRPPRRGGEQERVIERQRARFGNRAGEAARGSLWNGAAPTGSGRRNSSRRPWPWSGAIYRDLDPKTLVALGMKSLGESGAMIGNLNLNPDLVTLLMGMTNKE